MAHFDEALGVEDEIADFIVAKLHALRRRGNEFNFPVDAQAAPVMVDLVVPIS